MDAESRSIEEYLAENGSLTYSNVGVSMMPMLKQGRDLFTVRKKGAERARKYDVVLFKRPPDKYVLHRVVKVRPEGYDILGDNCAARERNVPEERVLGVLTSFVRKGREHSVEEKGYKLYSRLAVAGQPLRIVRAKAAGAVRKLRKLFCALLAVLLVLAAVLPGDTHKSYAEPATVFPTYDVSPKTEALYMNEGDSVQMQFHTVAPVVFAGLEFSSAGDVAAEFRLYRWDKNLRLSMEGDVLISGTAANWNAGEPVGLNFESLSGGALPAGEYLLVCTVTKGSNVRIDRYLPSILGINCFDNGIFVYGSYPGEIIAAEPVSRLFAHANEQEDMVYHTAPPEWTVPEDSAIAQMGVDPTKWTAVDGLGRTLPSSKDVGKPNNKKVGIFYWTWHYNFASNVPYNVNNTIEAYPESKNDYYHEAWKPAGAYFWNEPLYGYYTELDDYVLRNHAELLADAGVDFVLFDCTNGDYTWEPAYMNLLKVWSEARAEGIKTPQVGFMMQFGWSGNTRSSLYQVYTKIYKPGLYQDLWFYWEGKPLVMAHNSGLDLEDERQAEMAQFFTFRGGDASYFGGNNTDQYWGWLHVYPQALYKNADGSVEMTTVGTCMNADWENMVLSAQNGAHNMGRSFSMDRNYSYSYTYRGRKIVCSTNMENSKFYGINFQEQWDYALSVDPQIIFVTGWNEWIMGRNVEWCGVANGFPDQCDDENSRDCEPSKGALKDYYYYQLVANIRRFKGASSYDVQAVSKSIDIHGALDAWNDPSIVTYNHYAGGRYDRDADGWATTHYVNDGVRNDIITAKVSYDRKNLYFFVETTDALTAPDSGNWMRLLLDTRVATADSKDWEEFEYILNRTAPDSRGLVLERSTGGWNWETVGYMDYSVTDNVLQVTIPRNLLDLGPGKRLEFNFKWCDNNLADGDIMSLYTDGDAAPGGRFCFHFTTRNEEFPYLTVTLIIVAAVVLAGIGTILGLKLKKLKVISDK
ncbi:MAG: hypothetical protein J5584_01755 [Clostridia bacterium]|nr:hypothetical protein [Clostridia bacterium]